MKKTAIYYGSSTGTCEEIANRIAKELGISEVFSAADFGPNAANYDVLILGTSTWGVGDLQDDWIDAAEKLKGMNLGGKTVAIFGCGDCEGFSDTFCDGMKFLYDAALNAGANIIEGPSADEYSFRDSMAVVDGRFIGVALDEGNESDKTDERLAPMIEAIKKM